MACQRRNPTIDDLQKTFARIAALQRGESAAVLAVAAKVLVPLHKQQKTRVWPVPFAKGKRITQGRHTGSAVKAVALAQFPHLTGEAA